MEITIEVGSHALPLRVMGRICPECPGEGAIYPESSYQTHVQAHKDNAPLPGQRCGKCGRHQPWNRFPRTNMGIAQNCYDCRDKRAVSRGRPKGIRFTKTGIRSNRVWGAGQDEESD